MVTALALSAMGAAATVALAARVAAEQRIEILPSVGLSETYSDNIDFVADGERSGFTTNVTPRLRVGTTGDRLDAFAQYAANFRFEHFREGERPGVDHDANVRLDYALTPRWRVFVREDFRLSPDPTQDLAFVTPEGRTFRTFEEAARTPGVDVLDLRTVLVREDRLRNRLGAGTTYDLTPRWSAGADASWIVQDARDNLFVEDSQTYAGLVRTGYRLTPVDDVELSAGHDLTRFTESPDASVTRLTAAWGRQLLPTLSLDLSGGYAFVRTREDEARVETADDDLAFGAAALRGEVPQGEWRLRAAREVAAGDGSGDVSRRDVLEASLSRTLSPQLVAGGRLSYLRSRSVRGLGTEADTFEGTVSLSWRFIRWASARVSYRYRYEDPQGSASSIDENSALVGIDVLWPVRELVGLTP